MDVECYSVNKWCRLVPVTFLLDDDCDMSCSDWMSTSWKMKCIVVFIDQSEHDTWQSTSLVNNQRPTVNWETNIARFYKIGGLNSWIKLWGTKSKTGDKLGDQIYNFVLFKRQCKREKKEKGQNTKSTVCGFLNKLKFLDRVIENGSVYVVRSSYYAKNKDIELLFAIIDSCLLNMLF